MLYTVPICIDPVLHTYVGVFRKNTENHCQNIACTQQTQPVVCAVVSCDSKWDDWTMPCTHSHTHSCDFDVVCGPIASIQRLTALLNVNGPNVMTIIQWPNRILKNQWILNANHASWFTKRTNLMVLCVTRHFVRWGRS